MNIKPNENLSSQIYQDLKQKIEKFEYCPGDQISETTLSNIYQVSRTPIKQSLSRLENESLIEVLPQRGTFVAKINTEHIYEFFTIRKLLEVSIINKVPALIENSELSSLKANLALQKQLIAKINNENKYNISEEFWNLDNEFHRLIFKSVNKEFVWDFILSQSSQFNRFRFLSGYLDEASLSQKIDDHCEIFNFIANKNNIDIENLYDIHILFPIPTTIKFLTNKYPTYF